MYSLVLSEFKKSGISKATLARRMDKKPEVVGRWLGAPGNWTLDTVSDLLFAISGAELACSVHRPLDEPALNDTQPDWLHQTKEPTKTETNPRVHLKGLSITQVGSGTNARPVDLELA